MKLVGILIMVISFMQCGSVKFDKNPPFTITEATFNNWTGGQPGVGGTRVLIGYSSSSNIEFDSIYFKDKITKIEMHSKEDKTFLIGHFNNSNREKYDIIIDADRKKEINNKPPEIVKIPFELKENEAVISYKEDGKTKYFKIENIKQVISEFYK